MADARFFNNEGPFSLGALAKHTNAKLARASDSAFKLSDVGSLDGATATEISFCDEAKYLDGAQSSRAGALIVPPALQAKLPDRRLIVADAPRAAFAQVATKFYPDAARAWPVPGGTQKGVARSAKLGKKVELGAGVVIGAHAELGDGCRIGANAVIGAGVRLGKNCVIAPHCAIGYALLGDNVICHAGVAIGQDGFGFVPSLEGHIKVPQLGRVIVQADVEIGSQTTIDRGAIGDTLIGEGSKLDNLIQIGHNCILGRHCLMAGATVLAGSVRLGDFVVLGGQVTITGHVAIGDGALVAGFSAVPKDVPAGARVGGIPARSEWDWKRELTILKRLRDEHTERIALKHAKRARKA